MRRSSRVGSVLVSLTALAISSTPLHAQLAYLDASPAGPAFPAWDGGDTELEFADIDGDGNVDFLSIGDHGSPYINTNQHGVMVYFSDGAGAWSFHAEGNFGYGGIAVGDANNDGLLDVAYGMHHDYSGTDLGDQLIEVALGDGTGTSWTPWDDGLAANGEDWGMFATDFADFDADGKLDVVSGSFGCCNGVHVYRNNGDGSWTQTWARSGGNSRSQLATGDINGDGYPDFAAAYENGCAWINDGDGLFVANDTGLPSPGSLGLPGVALGDVDGDGCADLASTVSGGVQVHLWRTDHWEATSGLPASGAYDIAQLWDMDSDGQLDVVAFGGGTGSVWRGDGQGGWTAYGGFAAAPSVDTAAFRVGGDFDHNGRADLALVQEEGSWPNYQNKLYAFKEASSPFQRSVRLLFPRGNERFFAGSAQTLRWTAAQVGGEAAAIDLSLSVSGPDGPWTSLATGIADGGHRQWIVPGPASSNAHVRVTLHQGGESVSHVSAAFTILPAQATATPDGFPAAAPILRLLENPVHERARFELLFTRATERESRTRRIAVFSPMGRSFARLNVTRDRLDWDLRDEAGHPLPSGIYLVRLETKVGGVTSPALRLVVLR